MAQRHPRIAGGGDLGTAFAADPGAGVDRHRRVHQAGQDDIGAHAELGVLDGDLLGERDHAGLGRLVGHIGVILQSRDRRDHENDARALRAHRRQHMLGGHDGAAQVDGGDAVEGGFGEFVERRVAAGDAQADIVVQNIDAAPALPRRLDHRLERRLAGHVSFERGAFAAAARLPRHRRRLLGGGEIVVDGQDLGALLGKPQNRGAAIAHPLAPRLPGADHDGDFVFETHGGPRIGPLSRDHTTGVLMDGKGRRRV